MNQRNFPFRRNLNVPPVLIDVGLTPKPVFIGGSGLRNQGITSFKITNPYRPACFYRGWTGSEADMPTIAEAGHYLMGGVTDINSSQIPDWIAAVFYDEPDAPLYLPDGTYRYLNKRTQLKMIYGSGA